MCVGVCAFLDRVWIDRSTDRFSEFALFKSRHTPAPRIQEAPRVTSSQLTHQRCV